MKKIALLLAIVMALGCCFALSGCKDDSKSDSTESTPVQEAKDCVKYQLMAECALSTLGGSEITFSDCTYATVKSLSGGDYKISGTVKVRDQYGNIHVANYDAEVEWSGNDYDADISIGSFRKQ